MEQKNRRIWKSYVWHEDMCWFVSTIERTYDIYQGEMRGEETLVWEFDWDKNERGELVHEDHGNHAAICKSLIETGKFPKEPED